MEGIFRSSYSEGTGVMVLFVLALSDRFLEEIAKKLPEFPVQRDGLDGVFIDGTTDVGLVLLRIFSEDMR